MLELVYYSPRLDRNDYALGEVRVLSNSVCHIKKSVDDDLQSFRIVLDLAIHA